MSLGMALPAGLVQTNAMRGPEGIAWLERLPAIVAHCAQQWSLALEPPFPHISINYAAPAVRADGTAAVLKVCFPSREFYTEAEALRLFAGRGAIHLLAADLERGALLLERVRPGSALHTVADDREAARIAATVMRRLWRPVPAGHTFPALGDWMRNMATKAPQIIGQSGAFPYRWIERALELHRQLSASLVEPVLLHGDLHHENILAAEREPWLAIDPFGVVGEPVSETGPLLLNAVPSGADLAATRRILTRWVDHLASELGADRVRLAAWGVVRWVLANYWTVEDHGAVSEADFYGAQVLEEML